MAAQDFSIYVATASQAACESLKPFHVMGRACFATSASKLNSADSNGADVCQIIHAQPLDTLAGVEEEIWFSKQPGNRLTQPGLTYWHTKDLVFGVIEVPESAADPAKTLEQAAEHAYKTLFEVIDMLGCHHVWRTWNYLADINLQTYGLERYRQFNIGRQHGFARSARHVTGNVPAACAIGTRAGPLSVAFIAGRTPTIAIENPWQVSAYRYPAQYGPKTPTFSRASLATIDQQELLFLSGTASIVGHETVHQGDVRKQTLETLENIGAVVAQANLHTKTPAGYHIKDLHMRVYIRHASSYEIVKSVLAQQLGKDHHAIYVHADICRHDLDVEIEGIAWQRLNATL
jgi:chorismate lyase / 3-hydroxybenzoate synthase